MNTVGCQSETTETLHFMMSNWHEGHLLQVDVEQLLFSTIYTQMRDTIAPYSA